MLRVPPPPSLFPYTTLFRSRELSVEAQLVHHIPVSRRQDEFRGQLQRADHRRLGALHDEAQHVFDSGLVHDDVDRKSTRLNSSHVSISYAVFCLKKKKKRNN